MNHWLFKSEADTWSWDDQVAKGASGQEWDGVRNFQARNTMKAMAKGDLGFFYHSGDIKAVVGVVEVIAEAHPDSTSDEGRWECVDIRAVQPFPRPVTLEIDQGRPPPEGDGPGQELPPLRPAGDPRRMAHDLRDGRLQALTGSSRTVPRLRLGP